MKTLYDILIETPEDAAERECNEEVGARVNRMQKVSVGVNINHYYQNSFVVIANDELDKANREVGWAEFFPAHTLRTDNETGKAKFTPNFFIDLDAALASLETS